MIKLHEIAKRMMLIEALDLETAKKYTSIERNPSIQNQIDNIFNKLSNIKNTEKSKRGDRLYIPLKDKNTNKEKTDIQDKIEDVFDDHEYNIIDYIKNKATDEYDRETKITKLLAKLGHDRLLQQYNNDKSREGYSTKTNAYIVFSKHPYDIAGMSSGRGWTSCMNLYDGDRAYYLQSDVEEGTIIAYLISSNDKNIEKPIARMLIKPYVNVGNSNDVVYSPSNIVYGTPPKNFKNQVHKIFNKLQNKKFGEFKLSRELWCERPPDGDDRKRDPEIIVNPQNIRNIINGKRRPKNEDEIDKLCHILNISNYTINNDLSVDVDGNVRVRETKKQVPLNFNIVKGNFNCSSLQNQYNLITLNGSPRKVGGGFYCHHNNLTSLEDAPREVGGSFVCHRNPNLTSVGNTLKKVNGNFKLGDTDLDISEVKEKVDIKGRIINTLVN